MLKTINLQIYIRYSEVKNKEVYMSKYIYCGSSGSVGSSCLKRPSRGYLRGLSQ